MSFPPTVEPFKGTNWEECNNFVRAIRAAAWKEGKLRDLAWTADFASLHFSHKALTWHSRLPRDVRDDWEKLQVALLERWTPPEDDDEPRIEPTPAAAPSLNHRDRADRPVEGVLKVVIDGSNAKYYFKLNSDGYGKVTDRADEALRFRCTPLPNTTILERVDGSRYSRLAIRWLNPNPNLKNGSAHCSVLVLVDSLTLKASWGNDTPYQLASCTLSTEGEVIPTWEDTDSSRIRIGIFRSVIGNLCVAADPYAYSKMYPSEKRVKLFIEPID